MSDAILILNAGSSSLKFSVFAVEDSLRLALRGHVDTQASASAMRVQDESGALVDERAWGWPEPTHPDGIAMVIERVRELRPHVRLIGAGHRVVHGGAGLSGPVRIDEAAIRQMESLVALAPLHQERNIEVIRAVMKLAPEVPQVACFDTAFHQTQPHVAQRLAIPRRFEDQGIRRYGFHGLSYEYIASVLPSVDARAASGRTIVAHLGNGASLCAMREGRSVATTMGFTALDGLVMGTRCGSIDPGVILHLQRQRGFSVEEVERMLYAESGLLGVSGISGDMRTLLESEDPRAREAVELFVYRAAREIGSLAAALGGVDAVVFTGGMGEHAAPIRAAICGASAWLGIELDEVANAKGGPRISSGAGDSGVCAWVIPTNEEKMIALHTVKVLSGRDLKGV